MKQGDILHGFQVLQVRQLPEINASMVQMEYRKNGARLIWLDRPDDNMTFSIAFKTIPQDDTGVFHILEHSVLNGSQKYPVKEPFVELLKSSMSTFLNAMTFPDKTMYPVSSRNKQDFLNLMDVYLDAVLYPLSVTDPHAFRQEGWHYELDSPEGDLRVNGVVYNEMKGSYASSDAVLEQEMGKLLFPDNCYSKSSGGDPEHIPELTYENYVASHTRFYHPSNSYIFLDGQIDLDSVLAKLDAYLSGFERIDPDADIPMQKTVHPAEKTCFYEIGPEEEETNKVILAEGWVYGTFDEDEKNLGLTVLNQFLTGSNEAPLTKVLLDNGLAEDVLLKMDSTQQLTGILEIKNTDPAKKDLIWKTVEETLSSLAEQGLDKKRLHDILNRLEFTTREKDFGTTPRGLVYAIAAMDHWLYGGDPAQSLSYNAIFASLREKIDAGWFEDLLRESLLTCPHRARLVMLPSKTLGQEKAEAEVARCAAIKAGWDQAKISETIAQFHRLQDRQSRADTPEELACLPVLRLSDIPEQGMPYRQELKQAGSVPLLHHPIETDGITYLDLCFSLADLPVEKLQKVKLLTMLLGQTATEHYPALSLQSEIEGCLGRFSTTISVAAPPSQTQEAAAYLFVSLSMLADLKIVAVDLLDEILHHSLFDDPQYNYNIFRQEQLDMEQAVTMAGHTYGVMRVAAQSSARGAVNEAINGISLLRLLQSVTRTFDSAGSLLGEELAELCKQLFIRERLVISYTGPEDENFITEVINTLGTGSMGQAAVYDLLPTQQEGFIVPAPIGFAAEGGNLFSFGAPFSGPGLVAAQLLTYDYLWNQVRVKGGAYGVWLHVRAPGDVVFSSFRDPTPGRSLEIYQGASQSLRQTASQGGIEKYIISTLSSTEPILSPWSEAMRNTLLWLNHQSGEDLDQQRREILHTTPEELTAFADILDEVAAEKHVCIIGGKGEIDACGPLDRVEPLQI